MNELKLNLGCGKNELPGYINLDRHTGKEAYPLEYGDNTADEVRASHLLEHFPDDQISSVIDDWVRVLKPGGMLKIAVPDFKKIAELYLDGSTAPVQGYVMGGQVDENDYHKTIFDCDVLTNALEAAGLVDVNHWDDDYNDCSSLDVSLNLAGYKPLNSDIDTATHETDIKELGRTIGAVMSVPRLGFMDNFFCAFAALPPLGIQLRKFTGAFWGQCLTRAIDECINDGKLYVLTVDYDTIFTKQDVVDLIRLAEKYPEIDAIAPVQASRTKPYPLMTIRGDDGKNLSQVTVDTFSGDITPVSTAHFGLTLIKVAALHDMEKPWFHGQPDSSGEWGDNRVDDDIHFWRQFEAAGNTLFLANRVTVGHAELMIRWPGNDFKAIYQHPSEFYSDGKPVETWG